jgi:hypothetical protein
MEDVITPVPDRSMRQRMDALQVANEVRTLRANLKRDLKAGRAKVVDYLIDPPEWIETMKVFDLLLALPKIGRTKANKFLALCRVSPAKTIGGMTERQRTELVSLLRR